MRSLPSTLVIAAAFLASPATAAEWAIEGRVVRVKDGDTVVVLDGAKKQHEIRFAGSDSPEKGQPFYRVSGDNLAKLVVQRHIHARCYKVGSLVSRRVPRI
jgi:endonuclease YncB( thermonuclease family)